MKTILRKSLISLIIGLTSLNSNAVSLLKVNERAPHTGYLFSEDEAKKLQVELLELDYLKKDKVLSDDLIKTQVLQLEKYSNSLELLRTQNANLREDLSTLDKTRTLENGIYFILGIVLTGTIVYVSK